MQTVPARRQLGAISYRAARGAFEIRLRERPGAPHKSTYVKAADTIAGRRAAEAELANRIAALGRGEKHIGRRLTVAGWLDQWMALQVRIRPSTRRNYELMIRLYIKPVLGTYRLADLDPIDVTREFARLSRMPGKRRADRALSAGTVETAFRVLCNALADAHELGKAPRNATRGAKVAAAITEIEPPTQAELDRLFEALAGDPLRPLFTLMRWTGIRHGEALGLRWSDLRLEDGMLQLQRQRSGALKTRGSKRPVLLPPIVVAELRTVPRHIGSELVFTTSAGTPYYQRNVLRTFDRALKASGIRPPMDADLAKYRPHDLRHSFATLLLEAGVNQPIVAANLGHASTRQLDRYGHVRTLPGGDSYRRVLAAWGPEIVLFGLRPEPVRALALTHE